MPNIVLTPALASEYVTLFNQATITPWGHDQVDPVVRQILKGSSVVRYETVEKDSGVPWFVIAALHNMECSLSFNKHLHNGDSLSRRTVNVPAGRPKTNPPWTWEESALDSLTFDKLVAWKDWTLPGCLYKMEGYNGWGYRLYHPNVNTPYLWSGTNQYFKGKYTGDGKWDPNAVSRQLGVACIFRRLAEMQEISFQQGSVDDIEPDPSWNTLKLYKQAPDPERNRLDIQRAKALQHYINRTTDLFLKVDGWPGINTSTATFKALGYYLVGDDRRK